MDWLGLGAALGPPLLYLTAARRHVGFVRQPSLVTAWEPSRFAERLAAIGGAVAARTGVWVDLGFIAVLTVPSGAVLVESGRPGLVKVAFVAAIIDVVEDLLLLAALRWPEPSVLRLLATAAVGKYASYVALVVAVAWAIGVG